MNAEQRNIARRGWAGDYHQIASIPLNTFFDSGMAAQLVVVTTVRLPMAERQRQPRMEDQGWQRIATISTSALPSRKGRQPRHFRRVPRLCSPPSHAEYQDSPSQAALPMRH